MCRRTTIPMAMAALLAMYFTACGGDDGGGSSGGTGGGWEDMSPSAVQAECGLDPDTLGDALGGETWMLLRNGKPCHKNRTSNDGSDYVASVAKTFAAVTMGFVNRDTDNDISPFDNASDWISGISGSRIKLYHILSMSSHTSGLNRFSYDVVGTTQINDLSDALNKAIRKHNLASGLDDYVHNRVMPALGMGDSNWSRGNDNKIFAYSLYSTVGDMVRFGQLINQRGVFDGQRYMTEEWSHGQVHAANPAANSGYGYLTWLNARNWRDTSGAKSAPDLDCAPLVLTAADFDNQGRPKAGKKDNGVWLSRGVGGHFLVGHPGLDMVMAVKDYSGRPNNFWQAVLPAFVEASGLSKTAFCNDYSRN